jgi:hypothetical protein
MSSRNFTQLIVPSAPDQFLGAASEPRLSGEPNMSEITVRV